MARSRTAVLFGAAALLFAAPLAGCADKSSDAETVAVTATDDACELSATSFPAGDRSFEVTNRGTKVTEVYVYGDEDRIVGEVENIAPGTSRTLTVELGGGSYEVACKPGQKGDGIRTEITVSGDALEAPEADRTVEVEAFDHGYRGLEGLEVASGETIEFRLENTATDLVHEMEVFGPDGDALGEVGPTDPGETGTVTLTFDEPGTYRIVCGIDDHEAKGMTAEIEVA